MRIGIDARELFGRPTGVGRYLAELLVRWGRPPTTTAHEFILYAPQTDEPLPAPVRAVLDESGGAVALRRLPGVPGTWWEQTTLPRMARHDRLDRWFAPAYSAPLLAPAPVVLTIHDLSFVAHPEWFSRREGLRRRATARLLARRASAILTDSEFSRTQITELLGVPKTSVRVIPLGVSPPDGSRPPPDQTAARRDEGHGNDHRLILFVGSILNRRRVPDLLHSFAALASVHPELRLAIVGENRSHPHQDLAGLADTLGIVDRVTIASYVTEADLADLYARAAAFAFLSEYEGFGLTPLEALAAGVPIVVLDTRVARELYGDAALFVQPGDLGGTADALRALLFDATVRRDLLARAGPVLARYSWDRTAQETLAALEHPDPQP